MIVGIPDELQVSPQLLVAVIAVAFDGRALDRAAHPLDLTLGPGVIHLGQRMLDLVRSADPIKGARAVPDVSLAVGELDAVAGQDDVDAVAHRCDQIPQELRCL